MWQLDNISFKSRLLLGTSLYPSLEIMQTAIQASEAEIITVSIRRQSPEQQSGKIFWESLKSLNCHILPNTAGCFQVNDAVTTAEMARELFETNWIKLEVIGDHYNLQPDPFGLVQAADILVKKGFTVFPFCTDDFILCQRLVDCGCQILMPWGSPIGSGKGLLNRYALETLRHRLKDIILIIDAGIGKPSHAAEALEMGFDGVLLNSAVALAHEPISMAHAFNHAVKAGRMAYQSGLMPQRSSASPSTPVIDTPFWHQRQDA